MSEGQKQQADKCLVKVTDTFTLTHVKQGQQHVQTIKKERIPQIASCIERRFSSTIQEPVIQAMRIVDHTTWDCDDSDYVPRLATQLYILQLEAQHHVPRLTSCVYCYHIITQCYHSIRPSKQN